MGGHLLILFGGIDGGDQITDSLNIFDLHSKVWVEGGGASGQPPSPRYGHKAVYAEGSGTMLLFGGSFTDNTLYSLNVSNMVWSKAVTHGTAPIPRL